MDLVAGIDGIIEQLTACGVRATNDPRDVNPPCVLVQPPSLDFEFKPGCVTVTWDLWCMVGDAGRRQNLINASELIEQVQEALGWRAVSARPDEALLTDGSTSVMYRLAFNERIH